MAISKLLKDRGDESLGSVSCTHGCGFKSHPDSALDTVGIERHYLGCNHP